MALFDSVKEIITQKPVNLTKPDFYKADSDAKKQLHQLQEFYQIAPDYIKSQIEKDIKMLTYGITGEDNVAFELKNSYMPIIVMHDLYIEHDDLSAQIDYLIVTTKFTLIIECKNLIGTIEVNNNGDFIRTLEFNGKYKKEGIYSPITQNQRHLDMIKKIRLLNKNNLLSQNLFEKYFNENYKSIVVLANSKTVINMKYAKKEIKEQVIRCDQLNSYIKKLIKESKNENMTEKDMYTIADYFLSFHKPNNKDYTKKYLNESTYFKQIIQSETNIENTPIYKELKQYRLETSKAEGIKPYYIYNNLQLEELITIMPNNRDELKKISGFGTTKCDKYGDSILAIIKKYR